MRKVRARQRNDALEPRAVASIYASNVGSNRMRLRHCGLLEVLLKKLAPTEVPHFGDVSQSTQAYFFSHVIPRRIAVANVRRADARKNAKAATAAQSADNEWWSWALIAVIFVISAAAVWGPVIAGAI
jgi:hypothetical protein